MGHNWNKIISRYLMLAVVGTATILAAIPPVRALKVSITLNEAGTLLHQNQYKDAVARLRRVEIWASLFPAFGRRLKCAEITCHAKLADFDSAERIAREVQDRQAAGTRGSVNIMEILQKPLVSLINIILAEAGADRGLTGWSGYETLLNEMKNTGNYERMDMLIEEMLSVDPSNKFAETIQEFIDRKRSIVRPKRTVATTTTGRPPPARKVDHLELARKYVAQKEWDKALRECDLALDADPGDGKAVALKRLASYRDVKWGVVTNHVARGFDQSGNFIRNIDPGTVVEVKAIRDTKSGEIAECRIVEPQSDTSPVLLRSRDMMIQPGIANEVPGREKHLYVRQAQLIGEISKITSDAVTARAKRNPHNDELAKATASYTEFWKKAKELESRFNRAKGPDRVAIGDELRMMKGEDIRRRQAYDEAKKKFDKWQGEHPATVSASPKAEALKTELADVREQINSLEVKQ